VTKDEEHLNLLALFHYIVAGSAAILIGWTLATLMLVAGCFLKRRVHRTFCLVVAGCECLVQPFGVILGVFTIVVLMREPVKELFDRQPVLLREADAVEPR
jgi:hypothetical protein